MNFPVSASAEKSEARRGSRIVWVASYPRSGSTWVRMYFYNLVKLSQGYCQEQQINQLQNFSPSDSNRVYYGKHLKWSAHHSISEVVPVRRLVEEDIVDEAKAFRRSNGDTTFVKTNWLLSRILGHQTVDLLSALGAVYIVRNPLDIAVSLGDEMSSIDSAIDFMCTDGAFFGGDTAATVVGNWTEHVESWTKPHQDVCVVRYEDLISDARLWFEVIANHIFSDRSVAADLIEKAIDLSGFSKLQRQEERYGYDAKPRRSNRFFRSGTSGQWTRALKTSQISRIVSNHGRLMRKFGYTPES